MSGTSSSPVLLSVGEVARRLTISVRLVRSLIERGVLPTIRVTDRRVAIDEADLAAYIAARRQDLQG
jgi:excisionase family DNA binding protein